MNVEIREIVLRKKPKEFLATSPSGTVPSLRLEMTVLDESLDIMKWALSQNDPTNLMKMPEYGFDLISECDGNFKLLLIGQSIQTGFQMQILRNLEIKLQYFYTNWKIYSLQICLEQI